MRHVAIKPSKNVRKGDLNEQAWLAAPPFVINPRGIMTHRVRHVTTHSWDGIPSHVSFQYLCGNVCTTKGASPNDYMTDDPPADRLLCQRCEEIAKRAKLPSGDELAGRHVHRGILIPQQTCCGAK